ncbi:MAG: hypothetical protein AUJ72_01710 [Candidatus Omnitrophica bacterium CG1_02_46_14]|nr:MAG: hypothetical protein AUJ72_01710 [Candidatus Omnitrophica bacterium CG1_02_46_14]
MIKNADNDLARQLILDELFDLSLYKEFQKIASGSLQKMLDELVLVETKHYHFWEDFYKLKIDKLDFGRAFKLKLIVLICRLFGESSIFLILEAIEVYGIKKYLSVWKLYRNTPLADAVKIVLQDEFKHEDDIVSGLEKKKISPERIRVIFLGFNDGLVEFVGAVGGFFAAFQNTRSVLIASITGAAAGALSMAVGVYASSGSEREMQQTDLRKEEFLTGKEVGGEFVADPLISAFIVGISYLVGAVVPILPVLFGAKSVLMTWVYGGVMAILVTTVLSFISGMGIRKRVLTNLMLLTFAITVSYVVGVFANKVLGV